MSNFLFLPFIQRKKAVLPWVLSKVTVVAVFHFVCFFLNSQLPEVVRWQKWSELQIVEQTAYFKSGHLLECLFSLLFFLESKSLSIYLHWMRFSSRCIVLSLLELPQLSFAFGLFSVFCMLHYSEVLGKDTDPSVINNLYDYSLQWW